ncbi:MAG TPA: Fur family transcriptional regulator [Bacillota bacterium]|nr:Fur family transcriptional regulator [Bacillota bacterium]
MDIQKAIRLLRENGHKITDRRKDLIRCVERENRYITAKEVMNLIEDTHPTMSFDTVYRNLNLYEALEILEATTLQGEKHYRFKCSPKHHHHFICNDCGSTKKLPICPMDEAENLLGGYTIKDHKFEVYGLCPECQIA